VQIFNIVKYKNMNETREPHEKYEEWKAPVVTRSTQEDIKSSVSADIPYLTFSQQLVRTSGDKGITISELIEARDKEAERIRKEVESSGNRFLIEAADLIERYGAYYIVDKILDHESWDPKIKLQKLKEVFPLLILSDGDSEDAQRILIREAGELQAQLKEN
jgi:hypothetical protein